MTVFLKILIVILIVFVLVIGLLLFLQIKKRKIPNARQITKMQCEYENSVFYQKTSIPFETILDEKSVACAKYKLFKELDKIKLDEKEFFFDVHISDSINNNRHIDIIMLTGYGMFIFNVYNLNHVVTGTIDDDTWTAVTYGKKTIEDFEWMDNPIIIMKRNMETVQQINPFKMDYYPYIVYMGNASFDVDNPTLIHILRCADVRKLVAADLEVKTVTLEQFGYMRRVLSEYCTKKNNDANTIQDDYVDSSDIEE